MLAQDFRFLRLFTFTAFSAAVILIGSPGAMLQAQNVSQIAAAGRSVKPVADRLPLPIDDAARVTLPGSVHPLARAENDRGTVADGMKLDRIQVMLKRSDAQEMSMNRLIGDLDTPGSASYHKWLTPVEFGEKFGPSDADIAKLSSWLGSHGSPVQNSTRAIRRLSRRHPRPV